MNKQLRVDVVCGGPGPEAPVSRTSGAAIAQALQTAGHDVKTIDVESSMDMADLRSESIVFNIIHGTYGEDGVLQKELEAAGRVFIGSDAAASSLCMNKQTTKHHLEKAGLPVPWGWVINPKEPVSPKDIPLPHFGPLVLKPRDNGSSVGLRMLSGPGFILPAVEELIGLLGDGPLLLEERLMGAEYTIGIIGDGFEQCILPPICIATNTGIYDFEAKYERDDTDYLFVESGELCEELKRLACETYKVCGCRDLARVDIMARSDGSLAILEVNTLPGFTDHSLVPKAAEQAGLSFMETVDLLVQQAAERMEEAI